MSDPTRDAFEFAILEDPYDEASRKVYADWLDENDEPELADYHRNWTKQGYVNAMKWLEDYCSQFIDCDDKECMDVYTLLGAANDFLDTGEDFYLNFSIPDVVYDNQKAFWDHFYTVTGRRVPEEKEKETFFRCAC